MGKTKKILVTHPRRQHSHQLALALHDVDLLSQYCTGIPARPLTTIPGLRQVAELFQKQEFIPIPDDRVRHFLIEPILRKSSGLFFSAKKREIVGLKAMRYFDRWCAQRLNDSTIDMVIAYENAAYHTFKKAKKLNIKTVLDGASLHHKMQDRYYEYTESDRVHEYITAYKDKEITLADHILTVSDLAHQSYIEAGVSTEMISSVPLGCDLDRFQYNQIKREAGEPLRFIFAGHARKLKGIDLLLQCSDNLLEKSMDHELYFAGNIDSEYKKRIKKSSHIKQVGHLGVDQLSIAFNNADCLVLPSRFDSFGMVVVEAMASGIPAIVTENVGAKETIHEGKSGWIIPANDEHALFQQMKWCISNSTKVRSMGNAARKVAEKYSWKTYHKNIVDELKRILIVTEYG